MNHGESQLGKETYLAPMEWKDGWPFVNGGKKIGLTVEAELPKKTTPTHDEVIPSLLGPPLLYFPPTSTCANLV